MSAAAAGELVSYDAELSGKLLTTTPHTQHCQRLDYVGYIYVATIGLTSISST